MNVFIVEYNSRQLSEVYPIFIQDIAASQCVTGEDVHALLITLEQKPPKTFVLCSHLFRLTIHLIYHIFYELNGFKCESITAKCNSSHRNWYWIIQYQSTSPSSKMGLYCAHLAAVSRLC